MIDIQKLLKKINNYDEITKLIQEYKMTHDEIVDALPIIIDMMEEEENNEDIDYRTTFFIDENRVARRKLKIAGRAKEEQYRENILSEKYGKLDFEDNKKMDSTPTKKNIANWILNYQKDYLNAEKGFYVYGANSSGKSFLMKRLAKWMAKQNLKVAYFSAPNLQSLFKSNFNKPDQYQILKSTLTNVDVLFIDDLGAETIASWFRDEILFIGLDERVNNHRITFFASNHSLQVQEKMQSKSSNNTTSPEKSRRLIDRIKRLTDEFKI